MITTLDARVTLFWRPFFGVIEVPIMTLCPCGVRTPSGLPQVEQKARSNSN